MRGKNHFWSQDSQLWILFLLLMSCHYRLLLVLGFTCGTVIEACGCITERATVRSKWNIHTVPLRISIMVIFLAIITYLIISYLIQKALIDKFFILLDSMWYSHFVVTLIQTSQFLSFYSSLVYLYFFLHPICDVFLVIFYPASLEIS